MTFSKFTLPDTAVGAPSIMMGAVGHASGLYLAWSGTDSAHSLNVESSSGPGRWTDKHTSKETSPVGVSIIHFGSQMLMAWSGTGNQQLNVASSSDFGATWGNKVTLAETSAHRPTLGLLGNQVVMAWTGTDSAHQLNLLFSTDGRSWTGKMTSPETSIDAPYLASFLNLTWVAWTGTDAAHSLNVMSLATNAAGAHTWNPKVTLGDTSIAGPSLLGLGNDLRIAWAGTDANHSINYMDTRDGKTFSGKVTLTDSSDSTPTLSLGYSTSQVAIAWTGRDAEHHLNVATL